MPRRLGTNPKLYNIPAHVSFVDALARGIMDRYGHDALLLSEVLVLLPNRRAVRSLGEAFLRICDGKSIILPRMQPIGDVDEDGLIMGASSLYDDLSIKPAIPGFSRQIILMNIIHSWYDNKNENDLKNDSAGAALLADALGKLLDQIQTEDLDFKDLENIVPDEYSIHWQQTLEFLKILTEYWPDILSTTGFMDGAIRRNQLLEGLRDLWLNAPPKYPVIAAGTTGSVKATSNLLEVIARLPSGMVILPGLDIKLDDQSWDAIDATHPQATMKNLLSVIKADRSEVKNWLDEDNGDHPRTKLYREIMRPAQTTHLWRDLKWDSDISLTGIKQIITQNSREEAGIIALMMRQVLNQPGKTAALVTPDRLLARRVAGELARFDIKIDDSAGTPLFNKPTGVYLRLIAAMVGENMTPVPLLSALKHPIMAAGYKVGDFRAFVRKLEKNHLRGPRPAPGMEGISHLLRQSKDEYLIDWWKNLSAIIAPFEKLLNDNNASFDQLLFAHISLAEKLAATKDKDGATNIWKGDDGEAAATFIEELQLAAPLLNHLKSQQYPALFDQLMSGVTVRSKYGSHPRLHIWGPLEARLQHADLMILSGLNEASWPPEIAADPWMSRPMRKSFGLVELEQKIGLSAHDFVQTASATNVVITRSAKNDGAPTVKSRWLSRLHAITDERRHKADSDQWLKWYHQLDEPEKPVDIKPPQPKPPVNIRPRQLSVTRIQGWMQDPYGLYARDILRLKPLDQLDEKPGAADKGIIIHEALDKFMKRYNSHLPDNAISELLKIGQAEFGDILSRPTVWAFWWPRFEQIAKWFVEIEHKRRIDTKTIASEVEGQFEIKDAPGGPFILTAKADRIDRLNDGSYSIIDYKTGMPPSLRQIKAGFAPQLPLEAVIAVSGGFEGVIKGEVSDLSYWKLSGGKNVAQIQSFNSAAHKSSAINVMEVANEAKDGLAKLVATFDLQNTPYLNNPRPEQLGYGDYDHLARTKEWFGQIDKKDDK